MATLAFGVAGAAVGGYFGGPVGAQIGFLIGSAIGSLLFPEDPVKTEGPRLGDLGVSSSAYGTALPLAYGTIRLPGSLIWSSGINEVATTEDLGGKGGAPTQENTTYTYNASFAMAFGEGVADDVTRIWADSKLIYDKSNGFTPGEATAPLGTLFAGLVTAVRVTPGVQFKFYPGDEDQVPDATIEASIGAGNVPAFRGTCYIVFDALQLADYGNRIPNITAEITFRAAGANFVRFSDELTVAEGGGPTTALTTTLGVDLRRRRVYGLGNSYIRQWNYDTLNEVRQEHEDDILDSGTFANTGLFVGADTGYIYARCGPGNNAPICQVNAGSMKEVRRSASTVQGILQYALEVPIVGALGAKLYTLVAVTQFGATWTVYVFDADDMSLLETGILTSTSGDVNSLCLGRSALGTTEVWITQEEPGNTDINIHKLTFNATVGQVASLGGWDLEENFGTIPTSTFNDNISSGGVKFAMYDTTDDTLVFSVPMDVPAATSNVVKWDPSDGSIPWNTNVATGQPVGRVVNTLASRLTDGTWGWADSGGKGAIVDTTDGALLVVDFDGKSLEATYNPSGQGFWDPGMEAYLAIGSSAPGLLQQLFMNRAVGLGVTLDSVVEDISSRVGLDPASDLLTTDLASDNVRGYAIAGRQTSARKAIEPLAIAYAFDGYESDGRIKFAKRGQDPVRTIPEAEMAYLDEDQGSVVSEERTQEPELPLKLSVQYMDADADYEQGSQPAKRILAPAPTMNSHNPQSIQLPMVLSADEAAQIAERTLFTVWNERTTNSWRTSWQHVDLDPTDVVTLSLESGTQLIARVTEARVNTDGTVSFRGMREDKVTLASSRTSQGALGFPQKVPPGPADTQLFLLDIPLLRDVDDIARAGNRLYHAMNGWSDDWPGGSLWVSGDSLSFSRGGGRLFNGIPYGYLEDALPDTSLPFQTDAATQLTVAMQVGDLQSVTQAQFWAAEQVAVIGDPAQQNWEIVLFQNATETVQSGRWVVDTLLRGRRGTEVNVGTHGRGELFLVVSRDVVASLVQDLSLLSVTQYYRAVGFNQIVEEAVTEVLASSFNSLRPYAPCHLDAVVDGGSNIDLSWLRRTRVGGALRNGTGSVPLAEDAEEYEVEITDGASTVLRTFTGITASSKQYDNADIITDFGGVPSTITFRVYQVSAQVGRGFRAEATVAL